MSLCWKFYPFISLFSVYQNKNWKNELIFFCPALPASSPFALYRESQYWRCWQETVSVAVLLLKFCGWRELFWISWIGIFTQPHHWIFFTFSMPLQCQLDLSYFLVCPVWTHLNIWHSLPSNYFTVWPAANFCSSKDPCLPWRWLVWKWRNSFLIGFLLQLNCFRKHR